MRWLICLEKGSSQWSFVWACGWLGVGRMESRRADPKPWAPKLVSELFAAGQRSWRHCVQKALGSYRAIGVNNDEEEPSPLSGSLPWRWWGSLQGMQYVKGTVGTPGKNIIGPDICFEVYLGFCFYSGYNGANRLDDCFSKTNSSLTGTWKRR